MTDRIFQRAQDALRSYFGLGPAQLSFPDRIQPSFDIAWLTNSFREQRVVGLTHAPVAPNAFASVLLNMPSQGMWLIDYVTVSTGGPATSGFGTISMQVQYSRAGASGFQAIFDGERRVNKVIGTTIFLGRRFYPPLILWNTPSFADTIQTNITNDAGSVGNLTARTEVMARLVELTKE